MPLQGHPIPELEGHLKSVKMSNGNSCRGYKGSMASDENAGTRVKLPGFNFFLCLELAV